MDKVVHFEIPADDVSRAQKFYQEMFGWQINEVPGMAYHIIRTVEVDKKNMPKQKGAINGGLMKRSFFGEQPVIVIDVPSIDKCLKKAEKMNAKVVLSKRNVGEMGYYARISDPDGNIIGLWELAKK